MSYNSGNDLATYKIVVNPLCLKLNNGIRYKLEDVYEDLAVDFQTVKITCEPRFKNGVEQKVEWSYHSNKGTFWVPDETKVTIEYNGWPVGASGDEVSFTNTAKILGYTSKPPEEPVTLQSDHEGTASSYRIRRTGRFRISSVIIYSLT